MLEFGQFRGISPSRWRFATPPSVPSASRRPPYLLPPPHSFSPRRPRSSSSPARPSAGCRPPDARARTRPRRRVDCHRQRHAGASSVGECRRGHSQLGRERVWRPSVWPALLCYVVKVLLSRIELRRFQKSIRASGSFAYFVGYDEDAVSYAKKPNICIAPFSGLRALSPSKCRETHFISFCAFEDFGFL